MRLTDQTENKENHKLSDRVYSIYYAITALSINLHEVLKEICSHLGQVTMCILYTKAMWLVLALHIERQIT